MGGGENWKLPPGRETASLTVNFGSNLQRHVPEKEAARCIYHTRRSQ